MKLFKENKKVTGVFARVIMSRIALSAPTGGKVDKKTAASGRMIDKVF